MGAQPRLLRADLFIISNVKVSEREREMKGLKKKKGERDRGIETRLAVTPGCSLESVPVRPPPPDEQLSVAVGIESSPQQCGCNQITTETRYFTGGVN